MDKVAANVLVLYSELQDISIMLLQVLGWAAF
jgi:hypothetical protein